VDIFNIFGKMPLDFAGWNGKPSFSQWTPTAISQSISSLKTVSQKVI